MQIRSGTMMTTTRDRCEPTLDSDAQVAVAPGLLGETDERYARYLASWALEDDGVDWAALWTFAPDTPPTHETAEPATFVERAAA